MKGFGLAQRWAVLLVLSCLLIAGIAACESCSPDERGESVADSLQPTRNTTPPKKRPAAHAQKMAMPEPAPDDPNLFENRPLPDLPKGEGDLIYGWSTSERFFAFREATPLGEDVVYTLRVAFALYGRVPQTPSKNVVVSSARFKNETNDPAERRAKARDLFDELAKKELAKYRFKPGFTAGTKLLDAGSFVERFARKTPPAEQIQRFRLPDGSPALLKLSVQTRPQAGNAKGVESALDVLWAQGPDTKTEPRPEAAKSLLRTLIWLNDVNGYWLREAYLSPGRDKLVAVFESFYNNPGADDHGRVALFAVGVSLKAATAGDDGKPRKNVLHMPNKRYRLQPVGLSGSKSKATEGD